MNREEVLKRIRGLRARYPNSVLIPFARRQDNDDVVCFEKGKGETVMVIHDFASARWEQRATFPSLRDWFLAAVEEMIESD